jgi:hypothetical protein
MDGSPELTFRWDRSFSCFSAVSISRERVRADAQRHLSVGAPLAWLCRRPCRLRRSPAFSIASRTHSTRHRVGRRSDLFRIGAPYSSRRGTETHATRVGEPIQPRDPDSGAACPQGGAGSGHGLWELHRRSFVRRGSRCSNPPQYSRSRCRAFPGAGAALRGASAPQLSALGDHRAPESVWHFDDRLRLSH